MTKDWFTRRGGEGLVRGLWRRRRAGRRGLPATTLAPAIERLDARIALAADAFAGAPRDFVAFAGLTAFVAEDKAAGRELWVTDGTATGTRLLKDVNPGKASSDPAELTVVGSTLYFAADNGVDGRELWKSDGTPAGTVLVKDIRPGKEMVYDWQVNKEVERNAWSEPQGLMEFGGKVFFAADDGVHGFELWASDGTSQGTTLVKDIDPQSSFGESGDMANSGVPAFVVGGRLMVRSFGGLWASDGTEAGTVRVSDVTLYADWGKGNRVAHARLGDKVVFAGNDGSGNAGQPWITDGTEADTALIATITTPSDTPPSYWGAPPEGFAAAGSVVYFSADDGVHGSELWRTDGTAAGTTMIKDIATGTSTGWDNEPRPESSYPSGIVPFAGGILFTAEDGVNGGELWKSDGTAAGTVLVKDLVPGSAKNPSFPLYGPARYPLSGYPSGITPYNDSFYFLAKSGNQLWKTDGTTTGTVLVKDVDGPGNGSGGSGSYGALAVLNGALLFSADSKTTGDGLWTSDGTTAGTVRMRDLAPRVTSVVAPVAGTRKIGDTIAFQVEYSEPVTVTGKPAVPITVGNRALFAVYQAGSGTKTLSFSYTVAPGLTDTDGITAGPSLVAPGGATIRNAFRTAARRDLALPSLAGVLVDAVAPAVASVTPPANGDYKAGDVLAFVVTFTKGVVVTGTPSLELTIGTVKRQAVCVSQPTAGSMRFEYRILASDPADTNGIGLGKSIVLGGGSIRDAVGNGANLTLKLPALAKVRVVKPLVT